MVLEVATLSVRAGQTGAFEAAFAQAEPIIRAAEGYLSHELNRCVETRDRYILLVRWKSIEDHTERFRNSAPFQEWRRLLHHFYDPAPSIAHFTNVSGRL